MVRPASPTRGEIFSTIFLYSSRPSRSESWCPDASSCLSTGRCKPERPTCLQHGVFPPFRATNKNQLFMSGVCHPRQDVGPAVGTVAPANSARSAGLHLPIVALMAIAHLSMLSALG